MRPTPRPMHRTVTVVAALWMIAGLARPAAAQDGIRGIVSNFDGTFESAILATGGPGADYGAFAEQMSVAGSVTEVAVTLMRPGPGPGFPFEVTVDLYVWADDGGRPGIPLSQMTQDVAAFMPEYPEMVVLSFPLSVEGVSRPWVGMRLTPVNPEFPIALAAE